MNNDRIAKEIAGYLVGIFAMGALSKSVQLVEGRRFARKKREEYKEDMKWKLTTKVVKRKDGTFETKYTVSKKITTEDMQEWLYYSEEYFNDLKGCYTARIQPTTEKKKKVSMSVKGAVLGVGKAVPSIFVEGVKRRAVFELKDSSRNYAKSSKDTEIFIKNNIKNRLKHNDDMF